MAKMDVNQEETRILEAYLAGYTSPAAIAEEVFESSDKEIITAIHRLLKTTGFNTSVQRAKEDTTGSAIDSFKRSIHKNVDEMKKLATEAEDPRVRFQANKDILDRVGLAPSQKTDVRYSPKDYEKILDGLRKKDEPTEADTGSDGVVQETESPAEDRSSSS
ncbi:MAG: hypothetical protein V3V32_05345 [Dehalococcoidia bacterium]